VWPNSRTECDILIGGIIMSLRRFIGSKCLSKRTGEKMPQEQTAASCVVIGAAGRSQSLTLDVPSVDTDVRPRNWHCHARPLAGLEGMNARCGLVRCHDMIARQRAPYSRLQSGWFGWVFWLRIPFRPRKFHRTRTQPFTRCTSIMLQPSTRNPYPIRVTIPWWYGTA
jgi:hypothetical protein